MADTKISNLTALAEAPAVGDLLAIVDVSASETKKITAANLFTYASPAFGTQISTPAIKTASGALTVTPAAGSGVNVVLSTTGDFAVNTDDLVVDTSTGNVGIGTSEPTRRAVFATLSAWTASFLRSDADGLVGNTSGVGRIAFGTHATSDNQERESAYITALSEEVWADGTAYGTGLAISTTLNGTTTVSEVVRIRNDGNVGIGTTSPGSSLEVNGDIEITAGQAIKPTADSTTALKLANAAGTAVLNVDTTNKNLAVGGSAVRATTPGVSAVNIFNGTAPVGTLTNGISIYSSSGECYIMDAAGNATLQSPHDSQTGEWIFYSRNTVTGRVVRVNMERMIQRLGEITGEQFWEEWSE